MGTGELSRIVGNYQSALREISGDGNVIYTAVEEAWNLAHFWTFRMNYYYVIIMLLLLLLCTLHTHTHTHIYIYIYIYRTAWHQGIVPGCYSETCISTLDDMWHKRHHATRLLYHITSHPKANSSHFNKTHCPVVNNASFFLHLECRSGDPNILPDILVPLLSGHVPYIVHWVCERLAGCVKWSEVKWRCYGIRQWRGTCAVTSDAASYFASKSYEAGSVIFL